MAFAEWQQAAQEFLEFARALPRHLREKDGACGVWNMKQVVAHLAGWQREALKQCQTPDGKAPTSQDYDIDVFNADSVEALKLLNWHETLETYQYTCDDLIEMFQNNNTNTRCVEWLAALADDTETHIEELRVWLTEAT